MLLSLFPSIVLAGLVAARSVPKVAREDFVVDIVETISCTPLNGASGTLVIKSLQSPDTTSPVPLALVDNVLQKADANEQFIFENCTSTFMNETPSNDGGIAVYYGHITLAGNSSFCLSSPSGQPTEQNIGADRCSPNDDSSQMLQFWKLTLNTTDPTAPAPLDFVGKSTRQTNSSYYTTDFVNENGTSVAKINFVNGGNPATYYEINLVPT